MTFEVKTFEELVTEMKINLVNNVDEINDLNVGAVIDTIVTTFGNSLEGLYDDLNAVYAGSRISTALTTDLDELGSLVGVDRDLGVKSLGTVTFKATTSPGADLTILKDSQVSTQPNTTETQLVYNVIADTIFYDTLTAESHNFLSGTYFYKMDQRFINTVTTITGTSSSAAVTLVEDTDFEIIKVTDSTYEDDFSGTLIDNTTLVMLNDCDDDTEGTWTLDGTAIAPADNAVTFYQGTGSLDLTATVPGTQLIYKYERDTSIDASGLSMLTDIYIKHPDVLAKISNITIMASSDSSYINNYSKDFAAADLVVGWNKLISTVGDGDTVSVLNIDDAKIQYYKITIDLSSSTTIAAGYLLIDNICFATIEEYEGDIIKIYKTSGTALKQPDDSTNFLVTYKPLSVEVDVEAALVGSDYNVGVGKVVYKISSFIGITNINNYEVFINGSAIETDTVYRSRVQEASELTNVATTDAIRNNVLALSYIKNCTILDIPDRETLSEPQTFLDAAPNFRLNNLVPVNASVIVFSDLVAEITTPVTTTLNGGISDSAMSIVLTDSSSMADFGIIEIGTEKIYYSANNGSTTLTVGTLADGVTTGRGHFGTTAAAHLTAAATTLMSYENGLDFDMSTYFEVEFDSTKNNPVDSTTVYVDYDYEAVGFFDALVTGTSGELTATQLTSTETLIDTVKSAGIQYTLSQPTYIDIGIDIDISLEDGYVLSDVSSDVKTSIAAYIATLNIGDDVFVSKIIQAALTITGINDAEITDIEKDSVSTGSIANVVIAADESAVSSVDLIIVSEA